MPRYAILFVSINKESHAYLHINVSYNLIVDSFPENILINIDLL